MAVQLAQGPVYRGAVRRTVEGWVLLETESGNLLLNLDHVAVITHEASSEDAEDAEQSLEA